MAKSCIGLSYKIAEEAQLLAEEKWLIDALSKLKKQRNCLQIEKLYLESLKTKLRQSMNQSKPASTSNVDQRPSSEPDQSVTLHSIMTNTKPDEPDMDHLLDEISCNSQELNLAVSKSVFSQMTNNDYDIVEEEHDEDAEDIMLDINLLMQVSK